MVGPLICGPTIALAKAAESWNIEIESYNLESKHIAGDTFRVEVRFTNRTPKWMHNVIAELHYPNGTEPILKRFYKRVVARFPWENHFIDYDKNIVRFQFPDSIAYSQERFYSFFATTKYGKMEFDYTISWHSSDSLLYEQSKRGQSVFFSEMAKNIYSVDSLRPVNATDYSSSNNNPSGNPFLISLNRLRIYWFFLMLSLLLLLVILYIFTSVENRHRYRKLNQAISVLAEAQKKLISLEIERSKQQTINEKKSQRKK